MVVWYYMYIICIWVWLYIWLYVCMNTCVICDIMCCIMWDCKCGILALCDVMCSKLYSVHDIIWWSQDCGFGCDAWLEFLYVVLNTIYYE